MTAGVETGTAKASRLVTPVVVVSIVVYSLGLRWVYSHLVSPQFEYLGNYYVPGPWLFSAAAIAVTAVLSLLLPRRVERVSQLIVWVIYVVCVVPSMTMGFYTGYLTQMSAATFTLTVGVAFAIVALGVRGRTLPTPLPGLRSAVTWWVVALYSLATYGLMTASLGLSLRFVSFADVYDVRSDYKTDLAGAGILSYLISPQANIINPFLIARGIGSKNWPVVAAGVLGQYLIYSASGLKSALFSVPTVLIIALIFRKAKESASTLPFAIGPLALMLASALADQASQGSTWTSLFSRRFLLTPGFLSSVNVRFFEDNPQVHLGKSILRWWVDTPYADAPPIEVGQYLKPGSALVANANIFADGFANFGWIGVIGAGVGLLVYLTILDRCAAGLPLRVAAMTMIIPSITLSNAALLTAMLSHGLAAGAVLLAVAPRDGWSTSRRAPKHAPTHVLAGVGA